MSSQYLEPYASKILTASAAARKVLDGQRVFLGSGCATPVSIVQALEALATPPADVEFVHFLTTGAVPHDVNGKCITKYRHRSFFVGQDVRTAVKQGLAEYLPISLAKVPQLIENGRLPIDVALIQVSSPDEFGYVSLGISVDIQMCAVNNAKMVIAEVNPSMPWTMGDTSVHIDQIAYLVPVETPVAEYRHPETSDEVVKQIARYIASTISDGSTLQIGLGRIPNEALKYLEDRKDLGIHSDVITDAIIPLLEKKILTGRRKSSQKGKVVTSLALGSRRLYDLINRNPLFVFEPIDVVASPDTIAAQTKMVSITQSFAIDLTGQACSDQFAGEFYSGIAVQGEFLRGASRSPGGKPIICLASTTDDGETSRIRPLLLAGEGVSIARTDVHYVITEYGIAYVFGKTIRERAIALIEIAHPKFRSWLLDEAKKLGYLPADQRLENLRAYPVEDERQVVLKNAKEVLLRPAHSSDGPGIRSLFFKLPADDIYTRFFRRVKALTNKDIQRLCNFSYENEVGFVAVTGPREEEVIVGQCCYFVNPSTNLAETAFLVDPAWQGTGLGSAMQKRMAEHAKARGLRGFEAEVLPENAKMLALARGFSDNVLVVKDEDCVHVTMLF